MLCYNFQIIYLSDIYVSSLSTLQNSVKYYPYFRLNSYLIIPPCIYGQALN